MVHTIKYVLQPRGDLLAYRMGIVGSYIVSTFYVYR